MYVFLSSEAAIEIGRQINWGQTLYLCLTYARPILMEIKKESRRWRHYPQATSISNNTLWKWWKENSETFWNLWNEAWSSGLKERYMLKPAGLMLDEKVQTWMPLNMLLAANLWKDVSQVIFILSKAKIRKWRILICWHVTC